MRLTRTTFQRLPALVLSTFLCSAAADPPAPEPVPETVLRCAFGSEVRAIETLDALPQGLRDEIGPMAAPGRPFNSIDVITPGIPNRRFLRAGHAGSLYYVWYQQGGIFLSTQLAVYRMADGGKAELVSRRMGSGNPCRSTGGASGIFR